MIKYNKKTKFTIIELIAAIAVIAILISITVGVYTYIGTKTKNDRTAALIKKIEMAMCSYKQDTGYYFQQSTAGSLTINASDNEFVKRIDYTRMINTNEINGGGEVIDAWGNPIIYQCPGSHNRTMFDLSSKGKGGVDDSGGGDDITNFSKN